MEVRGGGHVSGIPMTAHALSNDRAVSLPVAKRLSRPLPQRGTRMSYVLALNDIVQVTIVCGDAAQVSEEIVNYKVTVTVGPGITDQQAATALDATYAPLMKALINNNATYRGVGVQKNFPLPRTLQGH